MPVVAVTVVAATVVKAPVVVDVAPMVVPLIVPPVTVTLFEFCVDIVPKPLTCALVIAIVVFDALVTCPWAFMPRVGTLDAVP